MEGILRFHPGQTVLRFQPGETIVLNFLIPFDPMDVKAVVVSFRDDNQVVFEAVANGFAQTTITDEEGHQVSRLRVGYTLTQGESLMFRENAVYDLQLNVYSPNGSRAASKEYRVETGPQHIKEVGYGAETPYARPYGVFVDNGELRLNYEDLGNLPQINEVTLIGNRNVPENPLTQEQLNSIVSGNE